MNVDEQRDDFLFSSISNLFIDLNFFDFLLAALMNNSSLSFDLNSFDDTRLKEFDNIWNCSVIFTCFRNIRIRFILSRNKTDRLLTVCSVFFRFRISSAIQRIRLIWCFLTCLNVLILKAKHEISNVWVSCCLIIWARNSCSWYFWLFQIIQF